MNTTLIAPPDATVSNEAELRKSIAKILDITLEPITFQQQLEKILDVIVSLSWLGALRKGAIFVTSHKSELVMAAHYDLDDTLLSSCSKIKFGQCLCGIAALEERIIFKGTVDQDHHITFASMTDHGHYTVPIFGKEHEVIGVLVLYLEANHEQQPHEEEFLTTLASILTTTILNRNLQLKTEVNNIRLAQAQVDIIDKLIAAAEFRDTDTGEHIKRMSQYSAAIAKEYGLPDDQVELLQSAAPLHDIGKVGISDNILLKNGKLTDEEFSIMKTHTTIGGDILTGDHKLIQAGREIALCHHERWDGKGYPNGLAGNDIPLFGRICALADVYDALTTKRPYKESWPLEKTLDLIRSQKGLQFDPDIVDAFFTALPAIQEIQSRYAETTETLANELLPLDSIPGEKIVDWQESLSVGINSVDNQHKYLINIINKLHQSVVDSNVKGTVGALLEMKSYSVTHFADEEKMLEKAGYPALEQHKKIHKAFINKTEQLTNDLEESPMATSLEIVIFLKDWLVNHIMVKDAEYALFLEEQNRQPVG